MSERQRLRIGELGRRVGLSEHVLRAWERRYGVLQPERSTGGFRLYTVTDEKRVRRMQRALDEGLSPAEAARTAIADVPGAQAAAQPVDPAEAAEEMTRALDRLDAEAAHAVLDRMLAARDPEEVLAGVVMPYLQELGRRWETGAVDVAQEHFASNLLRSRLLPLVEHHGVGNRTAVLACPPGELHDLPLLVLAVGLSRRGWRTVFLGADVPLPDLARTVHAVQPDVVVLAATDPARFDEAIRPLKSLSAATPVAVAGAGASSETATATGAVHLTDDPVTAADRIDCWEHR